MVYATCSLLPAEGEDQLTAALARHPGLTVLPPQAAGMGPERGGMDGFFIVCLRKSAEQT